MTSETLPTGRRTNWSGNVVIGVPQEPASIGEVQDLVRRAGLEGQKITVLGSAHSMNASLAGSPGDAKAVTVGTSKLNRILSITADPPEALVESGVLVRDLALALAAAGLELPNQGGIAAQTLAGAVATATHGTGTRTGTFSSFVLAVEFVDGEGRHRRATAQRHTAIFRALLTNLGCCGIVCRLRLRCAPLTRVRVVSAGCSLERAAEAWARDFGRPEADVELLVNPASEADNCDYVTLAETKTGTQRPGLVPSYTDPTLVHGSLECLRLQVAFRDWVMSTVGRLPCLHPALLDYFMCTTRKTVETASYLARTLGFWGPAERFVECEVCLRAEQFQEALAAAVDFWRLHAKRSTAQFYLFCRTCGPDELSFLSPASGPGPRVFISWTGLPCPETEQLQLAFCRTMIDRFRARPHWGKVHCLTRADVRELYPHAAEFVRVRAHLDPLGIFMSPYHAALLGP